MKTIILFLLAFFFITNTVAMQGSKEEEGQFVGGPVSATALETVALNDSKDIPKDDSQTELPDFQAQEELKKTMDLMTDVQTINDAPFSILEMDRGLIRKGLVTTGYYLKQVSGAAAMCWNFVRSYTPLSLVQSVSVTTASTYAEMIVEGDRINFPDISLNSIFELFDADPDRVKFANYYLRNRAFPFVAEGFNGTSMGYDGYAIIKDFAYGHRMVRPGEEYKVLSQYKEEKGRTRLDVLIALREHITLVEWLNKRFMRTNPMVLRKLGDPYKDVYGNTCILYELVSDPEGFIIEVVRKPKKEYEQLIALWQDRWMLSHPSI